METHQMLELLLARMNTRMKEHNQQILARMEANRKRDREQMNENLKDLKDPQFLPSDLSWRGPSNMK
jgi:hypothetical protein